MFDTLRLERKVQRLERKIDLIIAHLGIEDPSSAIDYTGIDDLLQRGKKIHAIKLYRDQDPSASLAEAKDAVEARGRGLSR
ncbi:hypothetical protein D7D52_16185 [Nocardia yunnanensis]|uniref:Uncharacterized protein n=1 Tax=Nocardia yunnanensis TaxID=2382165 RepID=A0A386ZF87_9NOCA|nr:hypothetical protein [Nocardia yunnanensis]AYF75149.1 hypothetical protein D7D52_16185 [Nocardia yunnanensis]